MQDKHYDSQLLKKTAETQGGTEKLPYITK